MRIFLLVITNLMFVSAIASASNYDLELPAQCNYTKAAFRYWQPDGVDKVKAVVVLVPGANADERYMVDDPIWQSFARGHNFALLACCFCCKFEGDANYCKANLGSGEALIDALRDFGTKTGQNDLQKIPLLLWGHSAGGQFNYEFACWRPNQVVAFIVNKGGSYHTMNPPEKTRNIPALFISGLKDEDCRIINISIVFHNGRNQGALWALAIEPDAGHEIGRTRDMAIKFFESVAALRLIADSQLTDLSEDSGFVADLYSHEIRRADSGAEHSGSWLPGWYMARCWQAFVVHK